jgi:hypothetical protein
MVYLLLLDSTLGLCTETAAKHPKVSIPTRYRVAYHFQFTWIVLVCDWKRGNGSGVDLKATKSDGAAYGSFGSLYYANSVRSFEINRRGK